MGIKIEKEGVKLVIDLFQRSGKQECKEAQIQQFHRYISRGKGSAAAAGSVAGRNKESGVERHDGNYE